MFLLSNPAFHNKKCYILCHYLVFCFFLDTTKAELTQGDFELAIENLVPSVSDEELRHYEKIQWEFNKNKMAEKDVDVDVDVGELELDGKPQPEAVL